MISGANMVEIGPTAFRLQQSEERRAHG